MTKLANNETTYAMAERREFSNKTGSLTGRWYGSGHAAVFVGTGSLPQSYADELRSITSRVYVVYSYQTPIAWASENDDKLTVPHVNYSLTTTQHQWHCMSGHRGWNWDGEHYGPIDPITVGTWHDNGTPHDVVRKGKGKSPYGARMGGF